MRMRKIASQELFFKKLCRGANIKWGGRVWCKHANSYGVILTSGVLHFGYYFFLFFDGSTGIFGVVI